MTAINRRAQAGHRASAIADRQHGVISRDQMRHLGFKNGAITHAVATGRLWQGCRFVSPQRCGLAGALRPPRREEAGTFDGIPCTSPARTSVDLAGVVGEWMLRSAFERAARQNMLDLAVVEASIDPRRRGMKVLLKLIEKWRGAAPLLRTRGKLKSPPEAKVLPLIVGRNLPPPLFHAPVQLANGRIEVDFLWPDHRFVLEADSRDFHGTAVALERDRRRQRELMRAGYSVLRVTSRQAEREAEAIAATAAAQLSRSS